MLVVPNQGGIVSEIISSIIVDPDGEDVFLVTEMEVIGEVVTKRDESGLIGSQKDAV